MTALKYNDYKLQERCFRLKKTAEESLFGIFFKMTFHYHLLDHEIRTIFKINTLIFTMYLISSDHLQELSSQMCR